MPDSKFLVGAVGGAAAVLLLGGLGTRLASGTESTTELNQYDTVTAVTGAGLVCTGRKNDGTTVDIPVTVINATDTHITWKFRR